MDLKQLDPILQTAGQDEGQLIAVLQQAQEIFGYLPKEVIEYIGKGMGLASGKVMGVATFYSMFRTKPIGKNLVMLCQGTACHVNGSGEIEEAIKTHLGVEEGEISADGLFTYNNMACLGCCSLAPVMMVGNKAYGGLCKKKVVQDLDGIKQKEGAKQ
ncbi:MAG: NAD(P)H-dependent oxidoreductase subunit E [Defluviitaleaceae bacterium]|nr:NAD(P)H-dependent oxidoreductase subunit E [Defluviitaleaceae bacterium]